MRVKQIMTRDVITATAPGSRQEALTKMLEHNISGLPVVNKSSGKLMGMVTRKDIFNHPSEEQIAMLMSSKLITVTPYTSVKSAAIKFVENRINRIPVVEREKLVGIVTPTDMLRVLEGMDNQRKVEEYVNRPCTPIFSDTPLATVLRIMHLSNASAMPVLNEDGRLVGILTDRDIFNTAKIKEHTVISQYGMGADEDDWTWEGLRNIMQVFHAEAAIKMPKLPAHKIMNPKVVKVYSKTPVDQVAEIMRRHDFGQLPLVDSNDRLTGMIYSRDLITALVEFTEAGSKGSKGSAG